MGEKKGAGAAKRGDTEALKAWLEYIDHSLDAFEDALREGQRSDSKAHGTRARTAKSVLLETGYGTDSALLRGGAALRRSPLAPGARARRQTAMNREVTPDLAKFVPRTDYDQMQQRAVNAEQQLADAAREKLETEINSEIDAALKAGKIAPASKDFYTAMCRSEDGLNQFRKFLETAPVIAEPSGLDNQSAGDGHGQSLNAEEQEIIDNLGISKEAYLAAE